MNGIVHTTYTDRIQMYTETIVPEWKILKSFAHTLLIIIIHQLQLKTPFWSRFPLCMLLALVSVLRWCCVDIQHCCRRRRRCCCCCLTYIYAFVYFCAVLSLMLCDCGLLWVLLQNVKCSLVMRMLHCYGVLLKMEILLNSLRRPSAIALLCWLCVFLFACTW